MKIAHYITPQEHQELIKKRNEIELAIKEQGQIIWEVTTQSSETRHDNAWFDEAKRVLWVLSIQFQSIQKTIENSKIITKAILEWKQDRVCFWSRVTVKIWNISKRFLIWGMAWEDKISYHSPLWVALMNKRQWEVAIFEVQWRQISAEIFSIG